MGASIVAGVNAGEMMDGLGLAETTPGPLTLVTEFVGFLAAYRDGGIMLGIAGAALTLWQPEFATFDWRIAALAALSGLMLLRWH
ncbi:hypothetical protein [Nisaea nitritireducens]|uniref:hypothetical protein n=1 Tax=Nisaea nitritireducens TaxID=568392 RepID=UPI001D0216A1|nr:hypothetical protein [Nisaea nitritireducens]